MKCYTTTNKIIKRQQVFAAVLLVILALVGMAWKGDHDAKNMEIYSLKNNCEWTAHDISRDVCK